MLSLMTFNKCFEWPTPCKTAFFGLLKVTVTPFLLSFSGKWKVRSLHQDSTISISVNVSRSTCPVQLRIHDRNCWMSSGLTVEAKQSIYIG